MTSKPVGKVKTIRAWAVVDEYGEIVGYQNYQCEPNDILMRVCFERKQAKQLKIFSSKIVQVEIKPLQPKRGGGK